MNRIRALTQEESGLRRLLVTFAGVLLVIAGLLAMHTLASGHVGEHPDAAAASIEHAGNPVVAVDAVMASMSVPATDMGSGAVAGGCTAECGPAGMPDHSALMAACVLALLAVAIVVLVPALLSRLNAAPAPVRTLERIVRAALPHPRPPSLTALSISRT